MSKQIDGFFDEEINAIAVKSRAIALKAAKELQEDVTRQIRSNFSNATVAFVRGVKVYSFDNAAIVRLSPLLSSFAEPQKIKGNPNLWILLPDGKKLGFKRIGKGFNWGTLKRRYGTRLRFQKVGGGFVLVFRSSVGVKAIYKLQKSVNREQKIEFFERAEAIASRGQRFEVRGQR